MRTIVDAASAIGPWGERPEEVPAWLDAGCPVPIDGYSPLDLPMPRGFIESRFITLVDHALTTCLQAAEPEVEGAATGIVLATVLGDTTTADLASSAVGAKRRPQPLLFYQSVPTSVLGHVSTRFGLTGPMVCVSGGADLYQDAMETVELLLADGPVQRLLVVYIDLGTGPRAQETLRMLTEAEGAEPARPWEACIAVLVAADDRIPGTVAEQPRHAAYAWLPRPLASFLQLAGGVPVSRNPS